MSDEESSRMEVSEEVKPAKIRKPGIIYLSTIPTGMTVMHVRSELAEFGPVSRIFLKPREEDNEEARELGKTTKRVRGAKPQYQYAEGWAEFSDRRRARWCADSLNATTVTTKKRLPWAYQLWNIKYLKGVKWTDLSSHVADERATRPARIKENVLHAKKLAKAFREDVQSMKAQKHIKERLEKKNVEYKAPRRSRFTVGPSGIVRKKKQNRTGGQGTAVINNPSLLSRLCGGKS